MLPRVRFAPSPTGYLHVGGARTALFNWLFARRHGGVFVLRIEDTDAERSSADMVEGILDGLRWLGLEWDEGPKIGGPHGPYFQSAAARSPSCDRDQARRVAATRTTATAPPEELKAKRELAEIAARAAPSGIYDRTCCRSDPRRHRRAASGMRAARDPLQGAGRDRCGSTISCTGRSSSTARTSKTSCSFDRTASRPITSRWCPTTWRWRSRMSCAATITSRTRRSSCCCIRRWARRSPQFAHVPLILGPDKKRLSKRHGATSVMEYARQGYLPEAMMNFLALLGWSPGTDQELFTRQELVAAFALGGISGGNAVFNPEKLDWFNQQHIARLAPDELAVRVRPSFEAAGLWSRGVSRRSARVVFRRAGAAEAAREEARRFSRRTADSSSSIGSSTIRRPSTSTCASLACPSISWRSTPRSPRCRTSTSASTEAALRAVADARGVKAASLIHASGSP